MPKSKGVRPESPPTAVFPCTHIRFRCMPTATSPIAIAGNSAEAAGRAKRHRSPLDTMSKTKSPSQLILWRHAHAEEGLVDSARQLTPRGRKQASRIAHWLDARLPKNYRLIASPAERAQQTALALGRKFQTEPGLSVNTSAARILKSTSWPESNGITILVGHQPTLGNLAALLVTGREEPWNIRKGAIWWLQREEEGVSIRMIVDPSLL